jgi:elongation factor Ts
VGTIGENIGFRRSAKLTVEHGAVATYVHNAVADGLGKLGVLVAIETTGNEHAAHAFARQVAMHVAATNPLALTAEQIDPSAVEREKAIFSDQARQSGKPEAIIEKMVEGRMRKFYEEVVLLKQAFVLNPDITVEKALKDAESEIGAPAKITAYLLLRARRGHREGSVRLRGRGRGGGQEVTYCSLDSHPAGLRRDARPFSCRRRRPGQAA